MGMGLGWGWLEAEYVQYLGMNDEWMDGWMDGCRLAPRLRIPSNGRRATGRTVDRQQKDGIRICSTILIVIVD